MEQKDTVNPRNSKEDVEAIGDRKVSCKMNWFSIEKEIALGKGLAQEVERSSKLIDDPVVTEYGMVNLKGRSVAERARALIGIAHPDFREQLEREAREKNIIPRHFFATGRRPNQVGTESMSAARPT